MGIPRGWRGGQAPRRGLWLTVLTADALELTDLSGIDWIGVDLQHGALTVEDLPGLLRAATLPTLARTASDDPTHLARVLDTGVDGIIVPGVESGDQAGAVVAAAYPPPRGHRSLGLSRSSRIARDREPLILAMIETRAGLQQREAIAATDGVDGILVGPYDLTLSLGADEVTSQATIAATAQALEAAARHGGVRAVFVGRPDLVARFPPADLVVVTTDIGALSAGIAGAVQSGA